MIAKVFYPARLPIVDSNIGGVFPVCAPETSLKVLQKLAVSRVCDWLYDPPGDFVLIPEPDELKQPGVHEGVAQ